MFKFKNFNPGLIPSPHDPRDLLTSQIIPEIKRFPEECPQPFDLKVLNQDGKPHCVGYAGATLKSYLEKRERRDIVFDGDWLYKKCKEIDGHPELKGTYLRALLKVLQKYGAKPLNGTEEEAKKYRISAYARVDNITFDELKKHIFVYGIVFAGFRGSNGGWKTAYLRPPKRGEKIWGHVVDLPEYSKQYITVFNSWGEKWGDKGKGYVGSNYLPFEAWVVLVDYVPQETEEVGNFGWVALPYLNLALAGNRGVTLYNLNLRETPYGRIIKTLPRGTLCSILEKPVAKGKYIWVKVKTLS